MNYARFDSPVLFMKLGQTPDSVEDIALGQAISYVIKQPSSDQYLFDIITQEGLLNHTAIRQIAATEAFARWKIQNQ